MFCSRLHKLRLRPSRERAQRSLAGDGPVQSLCLQLTGVILIIRCWDSGGRKPEGTREKGWAGVKDSESGQLLSFAAEGGETGIECVEWRGA